MGLSPGVFVAKGGSCVESDIAKDGGGNEATKSTLLCCYCLWNYFLGLVSKKY